MRLPHRFLSRLSALQNVGLHLPLNFSEEPGDDSGCVVESLPLSSRGNNLQLFPRRKLFLELIIHLSSKLNELEMKVSTTQRYWVKGGKER